MLKKTGIIEMFDMIVTNQDVNLPKPDPEGYNLIINTYGLKKEEVFIVEDSPKGKAAAYASGANVIEVKNSEDVTIDLFKEVIPFQNH